jgi:hypothetical protein
VDVPLSIIDFDGKRDETIPYDEEGSIGLGPELGQPHLSYLSRVVHNYVVERGWSGANEHYPTGNN